MKEADRTLAQFLQMGRALKARMAREAPLPLAQCELLTYLAAQSSPTMREVSEHFRVAAPTATALVASLAKGGWVRRVRDARDRRSVHLAVTPSGKRLSASIQARRKRIIGEVIATLSARDRRELSRILGTIIDNL